MARDTYTSEIRRHLARETGRIDKSAPFQIALAYPSPYRTGMSSLGFLQMYRRIQDEPGMCAERAFLPEAKGDLPTPLTYEGMRPLSDFPVVAVSVAYELEIAGLVQLLEAAGIPARRADRDERHPFILAGGPLTFSNPVPLSGFVDAIVMGEADTLGIEVLAALRDAKGRDEALTTLAAMAHVLVPARRQPDDPMPTVARCEDELLPAWSPMRTPDTELRNMFLLEAERGCSRGCTYCVMRRSTNGGMRIVDRDRVLGLVPDDAKRVGLVGAAVSDHPHIVDIVRTLAERGCEVGLSSLRPDRLSDAFVGALKLAGYQTLTTAMDGPSERMRELLDRRARVRHLVRAAELARAHGMKRLKLYLMIGLPGETDEDIDECVSFMKELSAIAPVALGIAPFCSKRNTPLDRRPFAGIDVVSHRLARLRDGVRGKVDIRSTSARWAWVEYVLAQGGEEEGLAVLEAVRRGGSFADYRRAFAAVAPPTPPRRTLAVL